MKKYVSIILTMFLVFSIHAQSAEIVSQILETDEVTLGQVCYLVAVEKGLMDEGDGYQDAVDALIYEGFLEEGIADENYVVPVVDIAYIMSKMWDIKGSLMYRITKGCPRYAFKQFKSDAVLAADTEPGDYISGSKLLSMYTTCSRVYGAFDISAVSMEE